MGMDPRSGAGGILEVVEAHMERAIRRVSVEQGADPRRATLVAFGGAGGLHATALARRLDMAAVAIPPYGGVFSAVGLLMAPPRVDGARSALVTDDGPFDQVLAEVAARVAQEFVATHGAVPEAVERRVDMRYAGQAHELSVPVSPGDSFAVVAARFHSMHEEINGFARPGDQVEVVTFRAAAEGRPQLTWDDLPTLAEGPPGIETWSSTGGRSELRCGGVETFPPASRSPVRRSSKKRWAPSPSLPTTGPRSQPMGRSR